MRWSRGPRSGLAEGSNPDILRSPSGADTRPIRRPHTYIGTETKTRLSREGKRPFKEGLLKEMVVTEDDREDGREPGAGSTISQSGVKPLSGPELGKPVRNVIPLPPRKPTNHSQSASPAVAHRPVASEDKSTGGSWGAGGHSSNTPQSPAEHSEKASGQSQEHSQEGRPRRVSEDRPKLDKSHSTPAYDMNGDVGQEGLSAPLAPVKPTSPARSPACTPSGTQVMLGESEVDKPCSSKRYLIFFYLL